MRETSTVGTRAGFFQARRAGLLALAGLAALTLSACNDYVGKIPKHLAPLSSATKKLVAKKGMEPNAPILIRLFKEESVMEVWKQQQATGRYALLKDYEICAWSGVLGPKIKEGDRQAPEGFYNIRPAQMNPNSSYHLSFNMGYPNDYDRAYGRTGSDLMVHGACSSRGCYSMTDEQIQEIYTLGRLAFEGGQRDFQVQAFPFRMTAENMARHRDNPNMPFWRMLKEGHDHFDLMRQPPKVDVCDKRYVFNAVAQDDTPFRAASACPPMMMPDEIRIALAKKDAEDDPEMLRLAAKLDRKEDRNGAALLAQALATPTTVALAAPMSVAGGALSLEPSAVGSIPAPATDTAVAVTGSPPASEKIGVAAAPENDDAVAAQGVASIAGAAASPVAAPGSMPAETASTAPVTPTTEPTPAVAASIAGLPAADPAPAPAGSIAGLPAPADTPSVTSLQPTPLASPSGVADATTTTAPAEPSAATLEERMQAEAPAPSPGMASAYTAPEDQGGLTGFVMGLFE